MTDSFLKRMLGKMHGASDCEPTSSTPVKKPPIDTDYHVSSDDEANNANAAVDDKNAKNEAVASSVETPSETTGVVGDTKAAAKATRQVTWMNVATKAAARSPTGKNARAKPKSAEKPAKKTATAGEKNAAKKAAAKSANGKKPVAKPAVIVPEKETATAGEKNAAKKAAAKSAKKAAKKPAVVVPEKEDAAEMVASENNDDDTDLVDVPMTQAHEQ
jgi:hypothetical protein